MATDHAQAVSEQSHVLSQVAEFPGFATRFAPLDKVRSLYHRVQRSPAGFGLENLLREMDISLNIDPADQQRIPAVGPVVVVANHPYGILDGAILTILLTRVRSDVKVLTNVLLSDIPELQQHCIFVDPFRTDTSVESNRSALREAFSWLLQGGMLAIFPAGEVSQFQMSAGQIADPEWHATAARLIRKTRAAALPVYFCGHNSVAFQLLGMIHPKLRTAFLLQEFLKQEGSTIEVRVGSVIDHHSIASIAADEVTEYLRWRTYLLGRRTKPSSSWPASLRSKMVVKPQEALACAVDPEMLRAEILQLSPDRCLAQNGDLAAFLGKAPEIPHLLHEVGRLREITFRQVGEGTNKSLDLDRFDDYYWHLLLWNRKKRELVGAYRAGKTADIVPRYGIAGLYTSSLFRYDESIFQKFGPAIELGRSFVRPEYQRQYAPLLLLWKGIAGLVALHPDVSVLFGAVSISNGYSKASREMIYRFFQSRVALDDLSGLVQPRRPFRPALLRSWDCRGMCRALRAIDDLSEPINDVEHDGKGLPILLRQYARMGGKLLGFNVDRKFSNVLDGLMVVDLRQTDPAVLERYMGRENAAKFRRLHGLAH